MITDVKKAELGSWIISTMHHTAIVPLALSVIYLDYHRNDHPTVDYATSLGWYMRTTPYSFGYILADSIYFIPKDVMKGSYTLGIHHLMTLVLFIMVLNIAGAGARFSAHFMVCEGANIAFNAAFFMRSGGMRGSPLLFMAEVSFAVLFFVLRVVNLSFVGKQ